jgi:hypothetical protein
MWTTVCVMEEMKWKVEVHGDRVVLMLPHPEAGQNSTFAFDTSADDARELAESISAAAAEASAN